MKKARISLEMMEKVNGVKGTIVDLFESKKRFLMEVMDKAVLRFDSGGFAFFWSHWEGWEDGGCDCLDFQELWDFG